MLEALACVELASGSPVTGAAVSSLRTGPPTACGRTEHETYVPAEQPAPAQEARLPPADAHSGGPFHHLVPPQQRPRSPLGVTVLPHDRRLHPRSRVRATIRSGRRVRSGSVVLHHRSDGREPQVAVVVGRALGGSVQRHRRQRQLRHIVADLWHDLPGGALVVRALSGPGDAAVLRRDLVRALERL